MFATLGRFVYRARFTVLALLVAILAAAGAFGLGLGDRLSQSGWDDPGSESVAAERIVKDAFGRDNAGDVVVLFTAPDGFTVDDPEFASEARQLLTQIRDDNPSEVDFVRSYWDSDALHMLATPDRQHAIASIGLLGENDTEVLANFQTIKSQFDANDSSLQLAGLQPVANALSQGMEDDIKRMELIALPAVAVLLFFIFRGVVAAALPVIIGVLTVGGAWGVTRLLTGVVEVNVFAQSVISLIGLGLAIDYGLFVVSRFREELAEGYDVPDAVRRTVATAGRTVVFSATIIAISLGGLLVFPQGFLKSVAYGAIAAVSIAALLAVTVLPALLSILGRKVDALGFAKLRPTKPAAEMQHTFWGRIAGWSIKRPLRVAVPVTIGLLLLVIPFGNIQFGGMSENYLPPDNETRIAQQQFDELFPTFRTKPIKVVITGDISATGDVLRQANEVPGFTGAFELESRAQNVVVLSAGLVDEATAGDAIGGLRAIDVPDGTEVLVGGGPAIERDSIDAMVTMMPLMAVVVVLITTLLMFLAFGSLTLPIKAVVMTALSLGSTLGILTWIFIDGHGASLLNFTPGPLMAAVVVLIVAIIYGLSTDYEIFLVSRMVEARAKGASTSEAIRMGTAQTGHIITAAALILIVVTGAFGFSEIAMMKYIAFGMIAALIIDATVIRMLLVPSVMRLLGEDCWWAPEWMKRIQRKIGLQEHELEDELRPGSTGAPRLTSETLAAGGSREELAQRP
ncbi:putative membrane protein, MmpL [Hoyosella subflava DQS3-9A1]|uniref:Putative membrane protein, MmpL n=1 Tax=Hoyosella subflava (strain DSM 45089 / JCM 17490 / NBRC 109087 / DQS3-9A1) TaxID=443218 RepID=F6EJF5_HOYSD|nr:putative membrane protein, MmpL [Hoyosella subflava DQS3-9A1]